VATEDLLVAVGTPADSVRLDKHVLRRYGHGMSLRDWWNRMLGDRRETAVEREAEREQRSSDEKRHVGESADELEGDEFAAEHLGGVHPDRLLGDGKPPAQDEPPV
jgi:hypothetical protein